MHIYLALHGTEGNKLIYITTTPMSRDVVTTPMCESISLYCGKCMPYIQLTWSGEYTVIVNGRMKSFPFPTEVKISWTQYRIVRDLMNTEEGLQHGDQTLLCSEAEGAEYSQLTPTILYETWMNEAGRDQQ